MSSFIRGNLQSEPQKIHQLHRFGLSNATERSIVEKHPKSEFTNRTKQVPIYFRIQQYLSKGLSLRIEYHFAAGWRNAIFEISGHNKNITITIKLRDGLDPAKII
jgi:hypothetical protein